MSHVRFGLFPSEMARRLMNQTITFVASHPSSSIMYMFMAVYVMYTTYMYIYCICTYNIYIYRNSLAWGLRRPTPRNALTPLQARTPRPFPGRNVSRRLPFEARAAGSSAWPSSGCGRLCFVWCCLVGFVWPAHHRFCLFAFLVGFCSVGFVFWSHTVDGVPKSQH